MSKIDVRVTYDTEDPSSLTVEVTHGEPYEIATILHRVYEILRYGEQEEE